MTFHWTEGFCLITWGSGGQQGSRMIVLDMEHDAIEPESEIESIAHLLHRNSNLWESPLGIL